MNRAASQKRGVTLIELLVVLGIITFLMSAMFAGLTKLRTRTQTGQARNLVEKLQSALETYHLKFRAYPSPTNPLLYNIVLKTASYTPAELAKNNEDLYYFMTTAFRKGANVANGEVEAAVDGGPFITGGLHENETMVKGGKTYITDPWHNPIVFKVERRSYPDPNDATLIIKTDVPMVYSTGFNGTDNGGTGDDVITSGQ